MYCKYAFATSLIAHNFYGSHCLQPQFNFTQQSEKDDRGRWWIGYLVTIRVSLLNGSSHEDCGSGEGINPSKIQAHDKALKSAVTDAMKRAARHFGERLGNALYVKGNGIRTAPRTNRDALLELERNDALNLFGDQLALRVDCKEEVHQQQNESIGNRQTNGFTAPQPQMVTSTDVASGPARHPSAYAHNLSTPMISATVGAQHTTYNTSLSKPNNQYVPSVSSVAPMAMQKSYNSANASLPNQYVSNVSKPNHTHIQSSTNSIIPNTNGWNGTIQQNATKTLPPHSEARGISPETTGVDASKRSLTNVQGQTSCENNSVPLDQDSNKRQKKNPYANKRLP